MCKRVSDGPQLRALLQPYLDRYPLPDGSKYGSQATALFKAILRDHGELPYGTGKVLVEMVNETRTGKPISPSALSNHRWNALLDLKQERLK